MLLLLGPQIGVKSLTIDSLTSRPLLLTMFVIMSLGMAKLNLHLGRPQRFYRGFYNWRLSPVSREIAGVSLFFAGFTGFALFSIFDHQIANILKQAATVVAVIGGVMGMHYMTKLYLIPARPFWNHWQTASSFIGTAMVLGASMIAAVNVLQTGIEINAALLQPLTIVVAAGLFLEALGLVFHAHDMKFNGSEGAGSYFEQTTHYGKTYWLRNVLLLVNLVTAVTVSILGLESGFGLVLGALLLASILASSILGRALFYVLVIPTTMPGAFFWRNQGFQEHARESGLADMPQTGVLGNTH